MATMLKLVIVYHAHKWVQSWCAYVVGIVVDAMHFQYLVHEKTAVL